MAAAVPPPVALQTVLNAIIACGVDHVALWNGSTAAERIASDVFDDDFYSCMDKSFEDLDDDMKSYSSLTVMNGQIRLNPVTKKNIRGFIQWSRNRIQCNEEPGEFIFLVADIPSLIQRYKAHQAYVKKSSTLSDASKPETFTEKMKWTDWEPSLYQFLRAIPGRSGIPLSYVIRPENVVPSATYTDFLDEYVDKASLAGDAFITDANH